MTEKFSKADARLFVKNDGKYMPVSAQVGSIADDSVELNYKTLPQELDRLTPIDLYIVYQGGSDPIDPSQSGTMFILKGFQTHRPPVLMMLVDQDTGEVWSPGFEHTFDAIETISW